MNSERRHELQENELSNFLTRLNTTMDPYSKPIAVGLVALLVGAIGWGIYSSQQSDNRSDATLQLMEASASGNSELLAEIAADYPGTSAAAWSKVYLASQKLAEGINSLFRNRGEAEDLLAESTTAYEEALGMSDDPILQSRAQFGLARVAESLGDVDTAIEHYEAAMVAGESEAMASEAKLRIERLTNPQTKEFLAWFQDQNFAPDDPALPPSLPGAEMLPDSPDVTLPELDLSQVGGQEPTADEAGMAADKDGGTEGNEEPAVAPETKSGSKVTGMKTTDEPSAEKPAAAESATAEKPAAEKADKPAPKTPAAEKPAADKSVVETPDVDAPVTAETVEAGAD